MSTNTNTGIVTVVSLHSTPTEVTLFTNRGERIALPADEKRTGHIVEKVIEALAKGERITVDLTEHKMKIFSTYQEKVGGLVKFFRVAKKALTGIDTPNLTYERIKEIALPPIMLDDPWALDSETTVVAVIEPTPTPTPIEQMIELGAAQREPEAVFASEKAPEPVKEPAILVGAEKIANQIQHGAKHDPKAVAAFMERVARLPARHTAQELLDFLNQGDLPLTEDGCIVAYKRLNRLYNKPGFFVDSHTGKVTQRVGSRVFMNPQLVDPDRRNQCSNGLHVGQRSYMKNFSGNAILIIIVAPEDVIAVPQDYNGSKMRCCGYDIVAEVNEAGFGLLCRDKPMTDDPEMAAVLGMVIKRQHMPLDASVQICGPRGTDLVFSESFDPDSVVKASPEIPPLIPQEIIPTQALPINAELGAREKADPSQVSPAKLAEEAKKRAPKTVVAMSKEQKLAQKLWPQIAENKITKAEIARRCKTSTRSLDRWEIKFGFK